jgi:hypothetical protein
MSSIDLCSFCVFDVGGWHNFESNYSDFFGMVFPDFCKYMLTYDFKLPMFRAVW